MGTREEFEKLDGIAETIKNGIYYDEKSNSYWSAVGASYVSLARINGAWYAFQEQQKKIDDAFLENAKLKHVIDQVKLHNGSLGFRSMQRMIEELLK